MKVILQGSHSEVSLERAKELLKSENVSNNKRNKSVRMSLRPFSNQDDDYNKRYSNISEHGKEKSNVVDDFDTLSIDELLRRSFSSRNSNSSTTSSLKPFNAIPKFILENLNDEEEILKHDSHKIDFEIINLSMCEDSSLLSNDKTNFLFVEYSFLNYKGHLLETQSLPKPKKSGEYTYYHFKRTFELRPSENRRQFKMLKTMLEKNSKQNLKFLIVSEPINLNDDDIGDCEEVGFGIAKLGELVHKSTEDVITTKIDCFSTEYPHELIAYLNIKITGALIIKKLRKLK